MTSIKDLVERINRAVRHDGGTAVDIPPRADLGEYLRRRKQETVEPTNTDPITNGPIDRSGQPTGERAENPRYAEVAGVPYQESSVEDYGQPTGERGQEDGPGEESQALTNLMNTDPRLIADPLGAPLPDRDDPTRTMTRPSDHVPDAPTSGWAEIGDGPVFPAGTVGGNVHLHVAHGLPQPGRNILAGAPVTARPRVAVSPVRQTCKHCKGAGFMPSINDLLSESIALVGGGGDNLVREFYRRLLSAAPDLAGLFPADLLTTDETKGQRDRLLKALVALSDLYDPSDNDKMDRLDTALEAFGRSHAAFVRADGTIKGATWEEYAAVKATLFGTLVDAAGDAWRPDFTEAWSQAYDYAAAVMLAEQYRSGFSAPRFPRG